MLRVRKLCPARASLCGVDAPAGDYHPLPGQGHCHRPRRCPAGVRQLWQKAGRRDRVPRQPGFSLRAGGQGAAVAPVSASGLCAGPGHGQTGGASGGRAPLRHEKKSGLGGRQVSGLCAVRGARWHAGRGHPPQKLYPPPAAPALLRTLPGGGFHDLRCRPSGGAAARGAQHPAAGAGSALGAAAAQRAGAAVSGAVDAVLQNAGNSGAPQRKRPHDPLPQALLGGYGGAAGGVVIIFPVLPVRFPRP